MTKGNNDQRRIRPGSSPDRRRVLRREETDAERVFWVPGPAGWASAADSAGTGPDLAAGIRAAVKSPAPKSSASARATCCGRSAGIGAGGCKRRFLDRQNGNPCDGPIMHMSMGTDSRKLVREAYRAVLRAAAFCSSVAGTIPRIFF